MSDKFDDHNDIFTDPDTGKDVKDPFTSEEKSGTTIFESEESGDGDPAVPAADEPSEEKTEAAPSDEASSDMTPAEGTSSGQPSEGPEEENVQEKKAEAEHDFDDEPKFDTQTGEPLDKPKSKVPGILLTLAVTAGVAGAIAAAFVNRGSWNSTPNAEVETEKADIPAAGQTESSPEITTEAVPESAFTEAPGPESEAAEETETAASSGAKSQTGKQTEALTESENTKTQETPETKKSLSEELGKSAVSLNTSLDVSDLVEKALPGVVSVTSQSVRTVESFFYGEQQIKTSNVGSGVIIDEDDDCYYIVTDAYLAARAQDLTVGFSTVSEQSDAGKKTVSGTEDQDGSETAGGKDTEAALSMGGDGQGDDYLSSSSGDQEDDTLVTASLVGTDAGTELAVLSVKKDDVSSSVKDQIQVAVLGDSDQLKIGERVVAIGDSLGYGQSVTQGIVSAKKRTMQSSYGVHDYIQTDASINYGNYGGALLNLDGEVIGINAGKVTENSAEGMGYALPVNDAKNGISNILAGKGSGLKESAPAGEESEEAKICKDTEIPEETETQEETEKEEIREADEKAAETETVSGKTAGAGMLGVNVLGTDQISEEDRIVYRVPDGVYIASVTDGSGAAEAGLKADDIITAVDGKSVSSVSELKAVLSATVPGDKVKVEYSRQEKDGKYGETAAVTVTLQ